MAAYTRQSTFADGDTITAALFNNEFNQLLNVFSNTGGHKHDGTAAEGPVIGLIGDAGVVTPLNKVLIDSTNDHIEFWIDVSGSSVQQLYIADGAIIPVTDSDVDLGTTGLRFKDAYIDTVTTTGNVDVGGNLTVTGTTTFNGGTITMGDAATDNVVFGADIDSNIIPDDDDSYDLGSSTQEWRNLYIDGTANIDSLVADTADINGGTIDGATIATSDITVGSGKTLNVSAGTLTLADNQISGDKVEGGTIAATTITDLTYGSLNDGSITITAFVDEDDMSSDSATLLPTQQSVKAYVDSQVTAQDLDFQGDSGGALSIDLDSESLTIAGGTGLDTVGSGNTVTVNIDSTVATLTGTQTLTNKTLTSPDVNTPDIDGGTVDGTVIGGATPAAGTFTTLTANTSITGTLATAAQPNITSVGTLTGLDVAGTPTFDGLTVDGIAEISSTTPTLRFFETDQTDEGTLLRSAGDSFQIAKMLDTGAADGIRLAVDQSSGDISFYEDTGTTAKFFWDASAESLGIGDIPLSNDGVLAIRSDSDSHAITIYEPVGANENWQLGVDADGDLGFYNSGSTTASVTFDDSGNVGIGTDSPQTTLHLSNNTTAPILRLGNEDDSIAAGADLGVIQFYSGDGSGGGDAVKATISAEQNATSPVSADLTFKTAHSSGSLTEYMRITSLGNVGIGTDSPSAETKVNIKQSAVSDINGLNGIRLDHSTGTAYSGFGLHNTDAVITAGDAGGTANTNLLFRIAASGSEAEAMRIDSSGRLGIGTTSPSYPLHVSNTLGFPVLIERTDSQDAGIRFKDSTTTNADSVRLGARGNDLRIFTGGAETFRIDSSGNVGIGTSSPSSALHIANSNQATSSRGNLYIASDTAYAVDKGGQLTLGGTYVTGQDSDTFFGSIAGRKETGTSGDVTGYLSFATRDVSGNTERMRIDSSGNVGIGTDSPTAPLHVSGSASTVAIKIDNTGTGGDTWRIWSTNDVASDGGGKLGFYNEDTATRAMTLDSSGNVGIGTTSPQNNSGRTTLTLSNATNGGILEIFGPSATRQLLIYSDTGESRFETLSGGSEDIVFRPNGSESVRFDSSGNVGIGTDSPSRPLTVNGNNGTGMIINDAANDKALRFRATGDAFFIEATNNAESAYANLALEGNVGIGTSSPSYKLSVSGSIGLTDGVSTASHALVGGNYYIQNTGAYSTIFQTNATERMRIDSSGNVLAGKTAVGMANEGIELNTGNYLGITKDNAPCAYLRRNTNDGTIIEFRKDTATVGSIGTKSGDLAIGTGDTGVRFDDANNVIYAHSMSSNEYLDAAVDLGYSGIRFKNLYLSGGVYANNASGAFLWNAENAHIAFGTNNAERMRIDSSGNVGIGDTSPSSITSSVSTLSLNGTDTGTSGGLAYKVNGTDKGYHYVSSNFLLHQAVSGVGHRFLANNAEAMRIDSSGNVGIGNSSPSSYSSSSDNLVVGTSGDTGITVVSGTVSNGQLKFADGTSGDATGRGIIDYNHSTDSMAFNTAATERMRIDSSGSVCIGATAPIASSGSEGLFVSGSTGASGYIVGIQTGGNGGANRDFIRFYTGTTDIGSIQYGSDEASVVYVTTSDYRLKENVQPLENGLDRVKKLNPVQFDWKESGKTSEGFLAHEIQEAGWYEGVSGVKDGEHRQGVDYGRITPLLVKAIQEQQTQIDALQSEINLLKGE